jgi:hypothetical protein
MSNLSIEVSVYGGIPIERACEDACRLATEWGITVCFKFNGVECMAIPGGDPRTLKLNWERAVDSKSRYPMATTHPTSGEPQS